MSELADLDVGEAPVCEPTENSKVEVQGLGDGAAGPVVFIVEAFTDGRVPAGMYSLKLIEADESAFYLTPLDGQPARRVHTEAVRAIETMGGEVVDDISEVPA